MNRKELIQYYRTSRLLQGQKPVFISLKKNLGRVYEDGSADFIMTISDKTLNFQRLSLFRRRLLPEKDFKVELKKIKSYRFYQNSAILSCLSLYTYEKNYLEIYYCTKLDDGYNTMVNIEAVVNILKEKFNVKELKDE